MNGIRSLTAFIAYIFLGAVFAFGKVVYVAQAPSGTQDGSSCANAKIWSTTMNSSDVFHLCGTISGLGPGTTAFIPPSGSSGSPTTIIFETGAKLSQTYWGDTNDGAITISNVHDVLIDGSPTGTACGHVSLFSNVSCNGIIENTANGTAANACDPNWPGYANQQNSVGIRISGDSNSNIEIRNLHVQNIYRNDGTPGCATDTGAFYTSGIGGYSDGTCSNCRIHNNEVNGAAEAITANFHVSSSNTEIDHNYIHDTHWGIASGVSGAITLNNITYHDNELTGQETYSCPSSSPYCTGGGGDVYHADGIILIGTGASPTTFEPFVYNNYFHGILSYGNITGAIFPTYDGATSNTKPITAIIFNNVVDYVYGTAIWLGSYNYNTQLYNNTMRLSGGQSQLCVMIGAPSQGLTSENNSCDGFYQAYQVYQGTGTWTPEITTSDYNNFYNADIFSGETPCTYSNCHLPQWQSNFPTWDQHSYNVAPQIDYSTYQPTSGSVLIAKGANLSSVSFGWPSAVQSAFAKDIEGNVRPTGSTAWDIGAYQSSSVVAPPSGLLATVN